jgi:hypothetical protein
VAGKIRLEVVDEVSAAAGRAVNRELNELNMGAAHNCFGCKEID